ncbi:aarF domain-containing kinase, partial [Mytilus galloprovincialis]
VKFVDDGTEQKVEAKKLFDLPQKLKNISFQAVDVYICRIKPIDSDEDWTPRTWRTWTLITPFGLILWLREIELTAVGTKVHKMYVRSELLKNGFAVDNPKHLQNLYELCKGKIKIPDINKELHKSEETLSVDLLPENSEFHEVYVSAVELPNLFFVQRKESCKQLEKMMDCLNNTMDRCDENMTFTEEDLNEAICAAKFPDDDRWYRVKVICGEEEGSVEVFYGDYGDKRTITREDLFQLPHDFMMVPFQAIECELAHVQPRGDDWDDESGDLFWDLTHMVNDDKKRVMASVVSKSPAVYSGLFKYEVVLYDTDTSDDVNLCQELVWSSLASPKPNSPLQELCPIPQMGRKIYKSTAQKIPDLCGIIYWEKITERAKKAPKDIFNIVGQNLQSSPLDLIGYKALASIIKMIGRISDPPSHQWILESLFFSARASQRSCRMSRHLLKKTLKYLTVGGLGTGSGYFLYKNDWEVSTIGVVRFGRAAFTALWIVADYKIHLRGIDYESPEYEKVKSEIHSRSALRLRELCCSNGGGYIKVGQHVGSLEYLLPMEYVETMKVLHNQAPQTPITELFKVLEEDLGQKVQDMFVQIDPEPLGAASLAQVHKATLKDGTVVAVKIQHPKVKKHSFVDIKTMELLVHGVSFVFPGFQYKWLAEETKRNLPLELDFLHEGRNCERVQRLFKHFKFLKIPNIYWDLSSERVLTMEFCEGGKVDNREYMKQHKISVDEVSRDLGKLYSEMIFVHGYVHCDPHPGNVFSQ